MDMHGQKQAKSPSSAHDGADRISGLNDDLLLHILRFMPEARDVARTSALSRQWRDISTRAPVVHLRVWQDDGANKFIHNLLTRRANCDAYIDTLDLYASHWPGDSHAEEWLRHAMHLVVGSLQFHVQAPRPKFLPGGAVEKLNSRLQLPCSTRATTMSVKLNYAILLLPPTVEFHALTDLALCTIKFADGEDDRLGRLLSSSSCCPTLRKLTLRDLSGLKELKLNGSALEILDLDQLSVRRLVVNAPRLSVLHLGFYFMAYRERDQSRLTIRAPALETLNSSLLLVYCQRFNLQGHTIQLLQECSPNVRHRLYIPGPEWRSEKEVEDEITAIPQFPGITNMTVKFYSKEGSHFRAIATGLLQRCSNLRYLHLDVQLDGQSEKDYNTGGLSSGWKHGVVSLKYLREVEFSGFSGQEYCFDLVKLLLVSAPALERMLLTMQAPEEGCRHPTIDLSSLESSLPCGTGKWTAHLAINVAVLEWTPDSSMPEVGAGDA